MSKTKPAAPAADVSPDGAARVLRQCGCGPVEFTGTDNALSERHLTFDHVVGLKAANLRGTNGRER